MIRLSQKDPRWGGKTIGKSNSLIKDYGCTITSISMLSDYYKCYQNPGWMAKNLRFLNDLVLWQSVDEKLCFKFVWRFYNHNKELIKEALASPKKSCLLQVYNRHWVVAVRKVPFGYIVADPWIGGNKFYTDSAISGGSIFTI